MLVENEPQHATHQCEGSSCSAVRQVVKLCRVHRLYSALTYILTRGLDDYIAPAVELVLALADAPAGWAHASALEAVLLLGGCSC